MSRRLNLSVLGSYSANEAEHQLADELGEGLASMKLNVVSGGQEGGRS
jgi:predicted Rossmann-fold nucleotide-binding protein